MKVSADEIARLCHETNRVWCMVIGQKTDRPWKRLTEDERAGRIGAVERILCGDITTPDEAHEAWLVAKLRAGWTFGAKKDSRMKSHPCMLPRGELPNVERVKDDLFFAIIKTAMSAGVVNEQGVTHRVPG